MKIVILCGGKGTRFGPETENKPKPMIEIGGIPILKHIMNTYAAHGFYDFILCLGHQGGVIRDYFCRGDFTVGFGATNVRISSKNVERGWKVTFVDTGAEAQTGARLKRIEPYIKEDMFMVTYGDGLGNVDLQALLKFHQSHKKIGTVTGVFPPSKYGELTFEGERVLAFDEKPERTSYSINGGYFVFHKIFFKYLNNDDRCVLEKEPLQKLVKKGELHVYQHPGFWQCMDTPRDRAYLDTLWANKRNGRAKWES